MRTGVDQDFPNLYDKSVTCKPFHDFGKGASQRDRSQVSLNFLRRGNLGQGVDYESLQQIGYMPPPLSEQL